MVDSVFWYGNEEEGIRLGEIVAVMKDTNNERLSFLVELVYTVCQHRYY